MTAFLGAVIDFLCVLRRITNANGVRFQGAPLGAVKFHGIALCLCKPTDKPDC